VNAVIVDERRKKIKLLDFGFYLVSSRRKEQELYADNRQQILSHSY